MAENLGQAQLELTVDLKAFRQGLKDARAAIDAELGNVKTKVRPSAPTGSGGRSKKTQEQRDADAKARQQRQDEARARRAQSAADRAERQRLVAQEKRFRLARRIDALEEKGVDVQRLRTLLGRATEFQAQRQFDSFKKAASILSRQVKLEELAQLKRQKASKAERDLSARGARMGGARDSIFALERAQDRRAKLLDRINRLEEKGVNVDRLRSKLGDVTTSYANRQFELSRRQSRELQRQVQLAELRKKREDELGRQAERNLKAQKKGAFPASPLRGAVSMPGSPKALEFLARMGGPRSPIGGAENIFGSPRQIKKAADEAARKLQLSIKEGGPRTSITGRLANGFLAEGSPAARRAADRRREADERKEAARIARLRRSGAALPISGRLPNGYAFPGSPAAKADTQNLQNNWRVFLGQLEDTKAAIDASSKKTAAKLQARTDRSIARAEAQLLREEERNQRAQRQSRLRRLKSIGGGISSGVIGGAFPALFGQGVGASAGGLLGGLLGVFGGGAGFAGSLLGTSIGAQADRAGTIGQALDAPIAKFQELKDAGAISSRALEKNVEALINAGRYGEAEAKIREDLAKRGLDAATSKRVAEEADGLKRAFSDLGLSIGLVVQGPLTDFIKGLNGLLTPGAVAAQSRAIQDGLSPKDRQAYLEQRRKLMEGGTSAIDANIATNVMFADKTAESQRASERMKAATAEDNRLLSAKYRLIEANVQGHTRLALVRERELAIAEKEQALRGDPNNALQINQDSAQRVYEINQRIAEFDQQQGAANTARSRTTELTLSALQRQISAERQLASVAEGPVKQFMRQKIAVEEAIKAGEDRVKEAGIKIDAARSIGTDPNTPEFQALLDEQKTAQKEVELIRAKGNNELVQAGAQFRSLMQESSDALRGAGDKVRSALLGLRSALEGSFSLLTGTRQQDLLRAARADLDAAVRAGFFDPQKVQQLPESQLLGAAGSARSVLDANNELINSQALLTRAIQNLESKDWSVFVNVPGNDASGDLVRNTGVYA